MSSDLEITGYEEPPPSPECINLTKEVKSRQRSLLEFTSNSPGLSGSTPKSAWPVFLQRFKPQLSGATRKKPVRKPIKEPADESSEEDSSSRPAETQRNTHLQKRCLELEAGMALILYNSSFKPFEMRRLQT